MTITGPISMENEELIRLRAENAKLKRINTALISRVEKGFADNGNSFQLFQVSAEIEHRIGERTLALEHAMALLEAANFALTAAQYDKETAQARLDVAVDTIADAFVLWTEQDTLARCNQPFMDLFPTLRSRIVPGIHFEDFVRWVIQDGIVTEGWATPDDWAQKRLAYHRKPEGSMIVGLAGGSWQRISERITRDGGRVGIYTDITEIKRQEMRLRESDQAAHNTLLLATLNSIRQGLAVFDRNGSLMAWNNRLVELLDLSFQDLNGVMPLALPEGTLCCPLDCTLEMTSPNGILLEVQYNPMPGDGFVLTYSDISERKKAELALRASETKMRLITDAMPALIAYVDKQQIYRFTNRAYEEWFGLPVEQINGRTMRDVLGPALYDARRQYVERALEGKTSVFELALPAPSRNIEYARATFIPHLDSDGSILGFYALIQDITQSRLAEKALEQAKEELEMRVDERTNALSLSNLRLQEAMQTIEAAQRSKTHFFAAASHDLLQPLNAARLFMASLSEQPLIPAVSRTVSHAVAALEAVDDLINTLLEISRLDAGAVTPQLQGVRLQPLLQQLAAEFTPAAAAGDLSLRLRTIDTVVHTDPGLLARILRNFLSNAIRYSRKGRILLACRHRGGQIQVGVWDQGAGIPEDKLSLVFEEFARLSEHHDMSDKGSGLGLAIVERLSKRLNHPLTIQSRFGRGSLFAITLPLGVLAPPVAVTEQASTSTSASHALPSDALILLIDNEPSILAGMSTLLENWGYRSLAARSVEEAISLLATAPQLPDAILADYHLDNGQTGIQALHALRERFSCDFPAALITADRSDSLIQQAERENWPYLSKPVRPAKLRAVLVHLLARATLQNGADRERISRPK